MEDAEPGLLHDLLGDGGAADVAPRDAQHQALVALDELAEGALVTALERREDLLVAVRDAACSPMRRPCHHADGGGSGAGGGSRPPSGKIRTDSSPAPISAALPAASIRSSSSPIAVAATMNGSDVACNSPAIAVRRAVELPR